MAGKGDRPRPVDPDKYREGYKRIFGHTESKNKRKPHASDKK